jgi:hypothetical protein
MFKRRARKVKVPPEVVEAIENLFRAYMRSWEQATTWEVLFPLIKYGESLVGRDGIRALLEAYRPAAGRAGMRGGER